MDPFHPSRVGAYERGRNAFSASRARDLYESVKLSTREKKDDRIESDMAWSAKEWAH